MKPSPFHDEDIAVLERTARRYARLRNRGGYYLEDPALIHLLRPEIPLWFFNTAVLMRPDPEAFDQAMDRFDDTGVRPRFEVMAEAASPEIGGRLKSAGLIHSHNDAVFWIDRARAESRPTRDRPVSVLEVDAESFPRFHRVNQLAFGVPEAELSPPERFAWWLDDPDHRLYLAVRDGADAGVAMQWREGPTGYLAAAGTLPSHRDRGVQSALIDRRIDSLLETGAEVVTAQATWGSPSFRNLRRVGLEVVDVKAVWARP